MEGTSEMRRRGILGTLGAALAAGPSAAKAGLEALAPALASPRPLAGLLGATAGAASDVAGSALSSTPDAWRMPYGPLRVLLNRAHVRVSQENEILAAINEARRGGYDPDIAANRSWSDAYKDHVQSVRIRERMHSVYAIREHLFGEHQ